MKPFPPTQTTFLPIRDIFQFILLSAMIYFVKLLITKYTSILNSKKLQLMGQAYCSHCCGQKNQYYEARDIQLQFNDKDSPLQSFAVKVNQMIQIPSNVAQIYNSHYEKNHIPDRRGTKLELHYLFKYAAYYLGEWKHGVPHGNGKLVYDDGSLYEGCFKQGLADCKNAIFIHQSGTYYRGQVKQNKANGSGILCSNKLSYKGQWINDFPNGRGCEMYSPSSFYQGDFCNGIKKGKGKYFFNKNEYYQGNFDNNLMNGEGILCTKDFDYKGYLLNGLKHGKGSLINKKYGWQYQGDFIDNCMHGNGKYIFQDGTIFIGQFKNDLRTNNGKLILKTGQNILCN